jgi:CRP-like cAMP-binding protein
VSCGGKPAVSVQHTPRQNHLLAALPLDDYEHLLPDLEPVPLPPGWTIHAAGVREKYVYFVTSGFVSRVCVAENGSSTECAGTGNEGVIGVAVFLGGESTPCQAEVLTVGHAYRARADLLKNEFQHSAPLRHLLLRYTWAMMAQAGQIAACNRHHTLEQRLCRWILSSLDRLSSSELALTQERIAHVLGSRREGITEAAVKLQKAGLIRYCRGHIAVLDRPRLEARACECYAVTRRENDRLLHDRRPAGECAERAGAEGALSLGHTGRAVFHAGATIS